jgi:S-adenosylmethionine synthetase
VQLAYAIGVAAPVSVFVDCEGTSDLAPTALERMVREAFPLKPAEIINYLDLRRPIYFETARHGHFGCNGARFHLGKDPSRRGHSRGRRGPANRLATCFSLAFGRP